MEQTNKDYIPFGPEWHKEMKKLSKDMLIDFFKNQFLKNQRPAIIDLEESRMKWSLATFTNATSISSIRKAEEEIGEIEKDILEGHRNPEEYADAIMCIFDAAGRLPIPITADEIMIAYGNKIVINMGREWKQNDNGSYSHIKKPIDNPAGEAGSRIGDFEKEGYYAEDEREEDECDHAEYAMGVCIGCGKRWEGDERE